MNEMRIGEPQTKSLKRRFFLCACSRSFVCGGNNTLSATLGCFAGETWEGEARDGNEASRRCTTNAEDPPDCLLARTGAGYAGVTGEAGCVGAWVDCTGNWGVETEGTRGAVTGEVWVGMRTAGSEDETAACGAADRAARFVFCSRCVWDVRASRVEKEGRRKEGTRTDREGGMRRERRRNCSSASVARAADVAVVPGVHGHVALMDSLGRETQSITSQLYVVAGNKE